MNRTTPAILFAAWAIHDLEECLTTPGWSRRHAGSGTGRSFPWLRKPVTARHQNTAVACMGVFVAAAAVLGARTRGSSPVYRAVTIAYGAHGFSHLGASILLRGYTPGVVTTPLTVLPYAAWAERQARRAHGPASRKTYAWSAVALPVSLGISHGVALLTQRIVARREQADPIGG